MKQKLIRISVRVFGWTTGIVIVGLTVSFRGTWLPVTQNWVQETITVFRSSSSEHGDDHGADHDDHEDGGNDHSGHDHGGHDETTSLELSATALKNLGLTPKYIQPIRLTTYRRSLMVPAMVVERPGRTRIQVATPMTGVVMHVHAVPGEAVAPETLLFQIRLTHEDLVQAQTNFLKTLGELDVEAREIARLTEVTKSGAVARKVLLEHEYSRDKLEALLSAQREALRLIQKSGEKYCR